MEMREFDMSDSETEFLLNPDRGNRHTNNNATPITTTIPQLHLFPRNRRKRVRKLGTILRFTCG